MNITAIIGIRNESRYLPITLKHLTESDINIILIDNDSDDNTKDILKPFKKYIVDYIKLPFKGYFDLTEQINIKNEIIENINADWVIHQDADEILESPFKNENLREGIERISNNGYNVINFHELVFIPTKQKSNFDNSNFLESMLHYYFFEPHPFRLMRAWKKDCGYKLIAGGHNIESNDKTKFSPDTFILRHYIALSLDHAIGKYSSRTYSKIDISKGWHKKRLEFPSKLSLPDENNLKKISCWDNKEWDLSEPLNKHFWEF